jgi:peptidoglycan hydrolase-like protein with peptidoglycan-binding domain
MTPAEEHRRRLSVALALGIVLAAAAVGAVITADATAEDPAAGSIFVSAGGAEGLLATSDDAVVTPAGLALPDLEGNLGQNEVESTVPVEPERADGGCTIGALSIRRSSQGAGVECLQRALLDEGFYDGEVDGDFDDPTLAAVMAFQERAGLFVDGVVGRESALELGIWPDEESLVVRTPPPPPDTPDSTGYFLSPVASTGADAPPLPDDSGSGRRVVYDRAGQRVWAVDENERIVRSWLVSGSKYSNETPGTHTVYSRSEMSTAWNGQAFLPKMIRYLQTDIGHIGFHGIPRSVADNSVYQTTEELGTRLSGGCQRQHDLDAAFLWAFADVGTTVVVT